MYRAFCICCYWTWAKRSVHEHIQQFFTETEKKRIECICMSVRVCLSVCAVHVSVTFTPVVWTADFCCYPTQFSGVLRAWQCLCSMLIYLNHKSLLYIWKLNTGWTTKRFAPRSNPCRKIQWTELAVLAEQLLNFETFQMKKNNPSHKQIGINIKSNFFKLFVFN